MLLKVAIVLVIALAALGWLYREPLYGYAETGAAVGARNTCACRYVAGRSLKDCRRIPSPRWRRCSSTTMRIVVA